MEDGDWKGVLGHFEEPRGYHEPLLVWIRPDVDTLHFIRDTLHNLGIAEILSIGSGCAFLEWLISKACSPNIRQASLHSGKQKGQQHFLFTQLKLQYLCQAIMYY